MREGSLNAALVAYDTSARSRNIVRADLTALEQAVHAVLAFNAAEQSKGPVTETAVLASLIIQWRARAKRLLEEMPYPGFAGEAEQLDRLAGELDSACNG